MEQVEKNSDQIISPVSIPEENLAYLDEILQECINVTEQWEEEEKANATTINMDTVDVVLQGVPQEIANEPRRGQTSSKTFLLLLGERQFKVSTKISLSVGLNAFNNFVPVLKLTSTASTIILLNEEWNKFRRYKNVISSLLVGTKIKMGAHGTQICQTCGQESKLPTDLNICNDFSYKIIGKKIKVLMLQKCQSSISFTNNDFNHLIQIDKIITLAMKACQTLEFPVFYNNFLINTSYNFKNNHTVRENINATVATLERGDEYCIENLILLEELLFYDMLKVEKDCKNARIKLMS